MAGNDCVDMFAIVARVRPLVRAEIEKGWRVSAEIDEDRNVVILRKSGMRKTFKCDHVHGQDSATKSVFNANVAPLCDKTFDGYNTAVLLHGQTGAGKSYTGHALVNEAFRLIFAKIGAVQNPKIRHFVSASYFEIYNEEVVDLWSPDTLKNLARTPKSCVSFKCHPRHGVYGKRLVQCSVDSATTAESLLKMGKATGAVVATSANMDRSRTSTCLSISLKRISKNKFGEDEEVVSTMKFVELPGSDMKGTMQGANTDRLRTTCKIDTQLSAFKKVVKTLADNATKYAHNPRPVPYDQSPLTLFLKDALGGNAKTLVMCMIAPSDGDFDDSMATLGFADKVMRYVRNRAVVATGVRKGMIKSLKSEIEFLADEALAIDKEIESAKNIASLDVPTGDEKTGEGEYTYLEGISPQERAALAAERREKFEKLDVKRSLAIERMEEDKYLLDIASMQWKEVVEGTDIQTETQSTQLENLGVTYLPGMRKLKTTPHLITLCRDPSMTGALTFMLEKGDTTIGRDKGISLEGLGIDHDQGTITNKDGVLTFVNGGGATTFVNGAQIFLYDVPANPDDIPRKASPTRLHHGDRILFGQYHLFLVQNLAECEPSATKKKKTRKGGGGGKEEEDTRDMALLKDWSFAMQELYAEAIGGKMAKELEVRQAVETKAALSSEKLQVIEAEMTSEKEKLKEWTTSAKKKQQHPPAKLRQEQDKCRHRIDQLERRLAEQLGVDGNLQSKISTLDREKKVIEGQLTASLPLVSEVNAYAKAFGKALSFSAKLVADHSKSILALPNVSKSAGSKKEDAAEQLEVGVEVVPVKKSGPKASTIPVMWNYDKFMARLYLMREMYRSYVRGGRTVACLRKLYTKDNDPFGDFMQHVLIGRSYLYLDSLSYFLEFEDSVPIVDYRGKDNGFVKLKIVPRRLGDSDLFTHEIHDEGEKSTRDFVGKMFEFSVSVVSAKGIPEALCSNVFVKTRFGNETNVLRTDPCAADTTSPKFTNNKFMFKKEITDEVCEYFETGSMEVEVYGAQPGTSIKAKKGGETRAMLSTGQDYDEDKGPSSAQEKHVVEVENLQNAILSERINTKQALDSAVDLKSQVDRLKTRIMQSGGSVEDKYKIENNSLKREMDVLKAKLETSSKRVANLEQKASKTKSGVCTIS
eukprot:g3988.t1